ncbi:MULTISPECIES: DUF4268 domain-containing protein [Rufibacter]|uniref:DUF4268 domain-containing protein n=1 Tax=Rufibacter quisquiliarum TaxID=1549639 RepID=A0A839GYQ5_9BACT|nr:MULTISPECIES: DUF4268 domain-containing protein [Rufibacter]MBA9078791.1 hypothetical protein [Rufibacter quisquiliarum]
MYTREQASQMRQAFWTTFGQYMAPIPSAEGMRINWSNYKTGLKNVYFRMRAEKKAASIGIEMTHRDLEIQQMFFEQFQALKLVLHETLGETWEWELHAQDELGETISRIYTELPAVNVFNKDDWGTLITFFKPRIIALDEFWTDAQYAFDSLK